MIIHSNKPFLSLVACAVIAAFASGETNLANAQVVVDYQKQQDTNARNRAQADTQEPAIQRSEAQQPDTTGVWYHISQQQKVLANNEFERLSQAYPQWQPKQDLIEALERLNRPAITQTAPISSTETTANSQKATGTSSSAAKKANVYTPSPAERMFAKLGRGGQAAWIDLSDAQFNEAVKLAEQANRPDYLELMAWVSLARSQYVQALAYFQRGHVLDASRDITTGIQVTFDQWVTRLVNSNQWQQLEEVLLHPQAPSTLLQNLDGLAWQYFNANVLLKSLALFKRTDNVYGQVLSLSRLGYRESARRLACDNLTTNELTGFCIDSLASMQNDAFQRKDYATSLGLSRQIASLQTLSRDQATIQGWSLYHLGDYANASDVFLGILQDNHKDSDAQTALKLSYQQLVAGGFSGSIDNSYFREAVKLSKGNAAWARKQFDLASDYESRVADRDSTLIYLDVLGSTRTGDAGLGKLDTVGGVLGISNQVADWRWHARLHYAQLYTGQASQFAWFGDGQVDQTFNSISGFEDDGFSFSLARQLDGINLFGELHYLLRDQPTPTKVTGQLSATWFYDENLFGLTFYRERVEDSLLSTAGTLLESSSEIWGGVVASGFRLIHVQPINEQFNLALNTDIAMYTGDNVERNNSQSVRLDINHDFAAKGSQYFDYLRAGPFLSWQHFEHNLSAFTLGHGGYFSPDKALSLGVFGELLTKEGRDWQIRASASLAYSRIDQAAYEYFPLQNSGDRALAQQDNGISANLKLEGQYLLAKHWQLAGYVEQSAAVEYEETRLGLRISYLFGGRKGLTSDELMLSQPHERRFAF